jgi:putative ABC transport system permease protein
VTLLRDLRYGARILVRNPTFAIAALGVMALGIGASTAVFSVLKGVLLTPLPYREPSRLVLFRADLPGYAHQPALTSEEFFALRERSDLFESVDAIVESDGNLTSPDDMAPLNAVSISDTFFETIGVPLALGRAVARRDVGTLRSVNISYELWQRRLQGDSAVVGRQIEINNNLMTVVGVVAREFRGYFGPGAGVPSQIDVFYPRGKGYDDDPFRGQVIVARLRRDVSLGTARAAVDTLARNLVAAHPSSYRTGPLRLSLATLDREVTSEVRPALLAVAGAVSFVLLVACANLTNLLFARASARTRELAVRISIGASRGRILAQLAAEGLVVGGVGACGGLLLAQWGVDALLLVAPAALPRREAIVVDATVAAFAVAASLVCALLVSLVPAWQATTSDVAGMLKQDPASSRSTGTTRGLLVASQLALSLMLLVGAGLMARAFVSLRSVPLGFDPRQVATMYVSLQANRFGTGTVEEARARRVVFYHQLLDSARQIPGVQQIGVGFPLPLGAESMVQRFSQGPGLPERSAEGFISLAGYLDTLRVPLVAGRYFTTADDDRPVVIVDERLAGELWPHQSGIGQRLLIISAVGPVKPVEVVGVVSHVQTQNLRRTGLPQIWMTYASRSYGQLDLIVRASNPLALVPALEEAVKRAGSGRPVRDIRLLGDYVAAASADTRFALFVLGTFAVLAVVLAAIGVYGVVAYATARRTREIAVRLALGADGRRIVALVVREGIGWTAAGIGAGVVGALALSRYLSSLLFHVGERDPITYVGVALLLVAIALVATALPAIRAVRVDPMLALRAE